MSTTMFLTRLEIKAIISIIEYLENQGLNFDFEDEWLIIDNLKDKLNQELN